MHPKAVRSRIALGALLLAGGFSSSAFAQSPTFILESTSAAPGQTAQVKVYLQDGPTDTSAINFTVSVPSGQADLLSGNMTGAVAAGWTGYASDQNAPSKTEYRAVVYPASGSSPSAVNTTGKTHVWTINVPIASGAANGSQLNVNVRNTFDTDGITGLVGISNAAGQSIHGTETPGPNNVRGIGAQNAVVSISTFGDTTVFPVDSGFEGFQGFPPFVKLYPTREVIVDPGTIIPGETGVRVDITGQAGQGINITSNSINYFGFFQTAGNTQVSPGENQVLVTKYVVGSTAPASDPRQTPTIRLRANADNYAQVSIFQEAAADPALVGDVVVPTAGNDRTLVNLVHAPASASNGTRDGFLLAFDVLAFGTGAAGNVLTIKSLEVSAVNPANLGAGTTVYSHNFATSGDDGFTGTANSGSINPVMASTLSTAGGLTITPADPDPSDANGFSFGRFEKTTNWTVAANKIYRVQFNLASTATTPVQSNTARLRVNVGARADLGLFDYVNTAVVESGGPGVDQAELPTAGGRDYVTYLRIPNELAGKQVLLAFDGYKPSGGFDTSGDGIPDLKLNGSVVLRSVVVTEHDAPGNI